MYRFPILLYFTKVIWLFFGFCCFPHIPYTIFMYFPCSIFYPFSPIGGGGECSLVTPPLPPCPQMGKSWPGPKKLSLLSQSSNPSSLQLHRLAGNVDFFLFAFSSKLIDLIKKTYIHKKRGQCWFFSLHLLLHKMTLNFKFIFFHILFIKNWTYLSKKR